MKKFLPKLVHGSWFMVHRKNTTNYELRTNHSFGFTLVELLVVITIIAVLAVIGISIYSGIQARARDTQRLDDGRKITTALEQYKSGVGKYPIVADDWKTDSTDASPWISGLDTSNFINNKLPVDPKNTGRYLYYYRSAADGGDYCLQITQENNSTGHPYYRGRWAAGGGAAAGSDPWQLRFGPQGPNNGLCNTVANDSP